MGIISTGTFYMMQAELLYMSYCPFISKLTVFTFFQLLPETISYTKEC